GCVCFLRVCRIGPIDLIRFDIIRLRFIALPPIFEFSVIIIWIKLLKLIPIVKRGERGIIEPLSGQGYFASPTLSRIQWKASSPLTCQERERERERREREERERREREKIIRARIIATYRHPSCCCRRRCRHIQFVPFNRLLSSSSVPPPTHQNGITLST